jgi:hypothetical protein
MAQFVWLSFEKILFEKGSCTWQKPPLNKSTPSKGGKQREEKKEGRKEPTNKQTNSNFTHCPFQAR